MLIRTLSALAISTAFLAGCNEKDVVTDVNINPEVDRTQYPAVNTDELPIIDIKATAHLFPDEKIIAATIAPKSGMRAFSSQILLLSESGKVYGTNTAFPNLELIDPGPFTDISGFYLSDNRSGFLTKGNMELDQAFIDSEAGAFEPIRLMGLEASGDLCQHVLKSPGQTTIKSGGKTADYDIEIKDDQLWVSKFQSDFELSNCDMSTIFLMPQANAVSGILDEKTQNEVAAQIQSSETVSITLSGEGFVLSLGETQKQVRIISGLSVDGIANPEWVFSTSQPLGNTFNHGVTLVRGDGSNRIVMIANDYLGQTVFGTSIETDQ